MGSIIGFFVLAAQMSFGSLIYDIYEVFINPFRHQKFSNLRTLLPIVGAAIMAFIMWWAASDMTTYRSDLGLCWVKSQGTWNEPNPWNWFIVYVPMICILAMSIAIVFYILNSVEIWKFFLVVLGRLEIF
eukprot:UN33803